MAKKKNTLFQDILDSLLENIIPSIVCNLKNLGVEYSHITLPVDISAPFFNYLNIQFPFNENNLLQISDENGQVKYFVIMSINKDGQISMSENCRIVNGLGDLMNNVIISDDYVKLFSNITLESSSLFLISKEFTSRAETLEADYRLASNLLSLMNKIRPKITRNVLVEKK